MAGGNTRLFRGAAHSCCARPRVPGARPRTRRRPHHSERVSRGKTFSKRGSAREENEIRHDRAWATVAGIAADVKNNGLAEQSDPEFYIPWKSDVVGNFQTGNVIVRSFMNPQTMASWIRSETTGLDPALPVDIQTMSQRVGNLVQRPKFNALLLSLFAATGTLLAAIGMYGVVGYLVAQRTREIGVRMALGASPQRVLGMILSHVARWLVSGALIGLFGAIALTRLLQSLLFHVQARDPLLLALALVLLTAIGFLAAWIPARRAMRVDPMIALRYE